MAQSIWKGEISFGLVSIPVSLVSTDDHKEIQFHLLDPKSKSRIRYQRVAEATGKEIPWNDIVKGFEYEKDNYIIVDEKAFEKKSPELFKTIDIDEFVDFSEIDYLYLDKPYYLVPQSKNKKAYVLLREALKKTNKVGVAKVIIRTKEYLSLIVSHDHALVLYLVHFKDELKDESQIDVPSDSLKTYKITDNEIKTAVNLIKEMTTPWEPEKYHNNYQEALVKWLDQQTKKQLKSGKKTAKRIEQPTGDVIDFIALLKETMKKKKDEKNHHKKSTKHAQ